MELSFLNSQISYIWAMVVSLFVIVDPFAVIPVYLGFCEDTTHKERAAMRVKSTAIAFCILSLFAISGLALFNFFHISIHGFRIAGGILLLKFGISQLSGERKRVKAEEKLDLEDSDSYAVFPLATPLLAGPGSISTVVLFSSAADSPIRKAGLVLAIFIVLLASYILLKFAPLIARLLGKTGLNLLTRIMGIIISAIAVEFILTGIRAAFGL